MKAPRFWSEPHSLLASLLAPVGCGYQLAGNLRRHLTHPYRANVPVICIGNITAGGSGKTPTAIAIAKLLRDQGAKPVFVSRGYGGNARGPLRVDPALHDFSMGGDEALVLARHAPCWIGRNRAAAVQAAEAEATHIILDDGLQNPTVVADYNLLVVDGVAGFGNGRLIPAGPLRETLANALPRLHGCVIIGQDSQGIAAQVAVPVFAGDLIPTIPENLPRTARFLAFAGIGRPEKFYASCRAAGLDIVVTRDFPDHHAFTHTELRELSNTAQRQNLLLITTEKDWVRLPPEMQTQVAVLPVALQLPANVIPQSFRTQP